MKHLGNLRGLMLASLLLFLLHLLVSCAGSTRDVVSPGEMRDFGSSHGERLEWFYGGSDNLHHHFLTRIADVTVARRVKVADLKLVRTWEVGTRQILRVFPERNFAFGTESKSWHSSP